MTIGQPCQYCGGIGYETKSVKHECEFTINGVGTNAMFDEDMNALLFNHIVPFEGNVVSSNRNENGNLIVSVIVKLPKGFTMETPIDVAKQIEVPVLTAMVGGEIEVEMVNGQKVKFKVKEGTEDMTKVRFIEKGLPCNGKIGDMYGYIKLKMPKHLSTEERETIENLKTHPNFS